MHKLTGRQNLDTKIKVQKASKRFQQQRRAKRREKLLRLFVELIDEFEELIPAITADIYPPKA
jgi:hypothetical protein